MNEERPSATASRDTRGPDVPLPRPAPVAATAPRRAHRRLRLTAVLTAGDALSCLTACLVAQAAVGPTPLLYLLLAAAVALTTVPRNRWRFTVSLLDDIPRLAGAVGGATVAAVAGATLLGGTTSQFGTLRTLLAGLLILAWTVLGRAVTMSLARSLRRRGRLSATAVVVGTGDLGTRLARDLGRERRYGVEVLGFVDDVPAHPDRGTLLGTLESLPNVVRDHRVDLVLVTWCATGLAPLVDAVRSISTSPCDVFVVPRLHELHDRAVSDDLISGVPLVRMRRLAFRSASWRAKRGIDVLVSALLLLAVAPLLGAIALAVRRDSGPGVIYRQQRVGLDGRLFVLYKFRSLRPAPGEDATRWNIDTDARLTPLGRFLRSSSLDELPQLVNVLKGDMSLVGPRPERPHFVSTFSETVPGYRRRHRMPPGMTGLAVINGFRGDTSIVDRAHYDNLYSESWCLWLDVKILLRTSAQLLPRRWRT